MMTATSPSKFSSCIAATALLLCLGGNGAAAAQSIPDSENGRYALSSVADGVVIAAIETGHDPDPFLRRAFAAVWEDQLNLADPAILVKLADDSGLPGKQLVERSESEEISAAYEQNRQDALAADVFGSPVYVLGGEVFWGQDRIELLADALKSGRAPYRSQVQDQA